MRAIAEIVATPRDARGPAGWLHHCTLMAPAPELDFSARLIGDLAGSGDGASKNLAFAFNAAGDRRAAWYAGRYR